jgi:hypothetical protein
MKRMPTTSSTDDKKKNVEEIAKILSSKVPKETNYNNTKTKKYFSSRSDINNSEMNTIKDTLLYRNPQNSITIENQPASSLQSK